MSTKLPMLWQPDQDADVWVTAGNTLPPQKMTPGECIAYIKWLLSATIIN
jgi:hypothetical protein